MGMTLHPSSQAGVPKCTLSRLQCRRSTAESRLPARAGCVHPPGRTVPPMPMDGGGNGPAPGAVRHWGRMRVNQLGQPVSCSYAGSVRKSA